MATLSHVESRRLYSWWWDSHISPKNSKWLQENLTDMDAKVKAMIKLIEEDADSFARRAEMYYKKRPELMKLVEEFYRAYRALAERYDHATGALRQAHRTMAEAFPNQIPFALTEDSPSGSSATEAEPRTPETPHPMNSLFDPDHDDMQKDALGLSSHLHVIKRNGAYSDDNDAVARKKGLKQLSEIFAPAEGVDHVKLGEGRVRKGLNFREEEGENSGNQTHNASRDLQRHEDKEEAGGKTRTLQDQISKLLTENQNLEKRVMSETERAGKAEAEVESRGKALSALKAEKEAALCQYQQCLDRVLNHEAEVSRQQEDLNRLQSEISKLSADKQNLEKRVISESERAGKAVTNVERLREALSALEAEKEAALHQYQQCLERVSNLEAEISSRQEDLKRLDGEISKLSTENQNLEKRVMLESERAAKAEAEIENRQKALSILQAEKETALHQYQKCLERLSNLEAEISQGQQDVNKLNGEISKLSIENQALEKRVVSESERAGKAETEIESLRETLSALLAEKEAALHQYQQCFGRVSNLEAEISRGQEDVNRLNDKLQMVSVALNGAEERSLLLEKMNQSLQSEVGTLVQKAAMQQQELASKNEELEKLSICIHDERLHLMRAETALQSLQDMHFRSQEEQRVLALELQNGVQVLKDMEFMKQSLENQVQQIKKENHHLDEQNLSSALSIKNLQDEIFGLKEANAKLEEEIGLRIDQRNALQQEIYCMKEEVNDLRRKHRDVIVQVESVGLNAESLQSSVKVLQDENLNLKEICKRNEDDKAILSKKLEDMEKLLEKNAVLENSLSDVSAELEGSREKLKVLEESLESLQVEKSSLITEKDTLVSQVECMMQNVEKLVEKNTFLENSVSEANVGLEELRGKLKNLEESYQSLHAEKSGLVTERDGLFSQVEIIGQILEELEKRHADLENERLQLEKERELALHHVDELQLSLDLEKQERASYIQSSNGRLAALENQIHHLRDESEGREKELEEEHDNIVNARVEIFVLQSCVNDLKARILTLSMECRDLLEASVHAEKQISELKKENHLHQEKAKFLLKNDEKLRKGWHQVLESLNINAHGEFQDAYFVLILEKIKHMHDSILDAEDEKLRLLFEKAVFITLLEQLRQMELALRSEKYAVELDSEIKTKELLILQAEKHELIEMNEGLRQEVQVGHGSVELLQGQMEMMHQQLSDSREAYRTSLNENCKLHEENRSLAKELCDMREENNMLEGENNDIVRDAMILGNLSLVFESISNEKALELKVLTDDLNHLRVINDDLEKVRLMAETLEAENLHLRNSVEKLEEVRSHALILEDELVKIRNVSDHLNHQIVVGKDLLSQKEVELAQVDLKLEAMQNDNTLLCEEIVELRLKEENSNSQLSEKSKEVELWETEAAALYNDLQISAICSAVFKEKACELVESCKSLEENATIDRKMFNDESISRNADFEELKGKISLLERENGGMQAELTAYVPLIVCLKDSISSLEDRMLSLTGCRVTDNQETQDAAARRNQHGMGDRELNGVQSLVVPAGVLELQNLQIKVQTIEKAVMEMENLAMKERSLTNARLEDATKEIEELKLKNSLVQEEVQTSKDIIIQLEEETSGCDKNVEQQRGEASKMKHGMIVKDIQLDHVSDSSSHEHSGSYGVSRRGNASTDDQMLELWETAEQGSSCEQPADKTKNLASTATEDMIEYHQIEAVEELKSEYPSSELQAEKELAVDKLEVPKKSAEPQQERNKKILERLSSDARRLTNLQASIQELKKKTQNADKSKQLAGVEYDNVKGQLKEVEQSISKLVDINSKWMKKAEDGSTSFDSKDEESQETRNVGNRQLSVRARRWSEKIGRLELELQRIQFVLLKLEDEHESKGTKAIGRRTRVLLRDYIYGGRVNQGRKKRHLCACMRPSTRDD